MNGWGGVRQHKGERVIAAANALCYDRRLPEADRPITRIKPILSRPETTFFTRLVNAFTDMADTPGADVTVHRTMIAQDPVEGTARG